MTPRRSISLIVAVLAAAQLGATDCGQVTRDPGFDLWCGEQLCVWKLERGEVARVTTWHEGDDGVDLVGADTAISQLTAVTSSDGACIEFELIADLAAGPVVELQVDIYGDGSFETEFTLPQAAWAPLRYRFRIDGDYDGIAFWISKTGAGRAVVAQMSAHTFDCAEEGGGEPITTHRPAPNGARCTTGAECASGTCTAFAPPFDTLQQRCSTCTAGGTCPNAGDVCGVEVPAQHTLLPHSACVPPASRQLGELCGTNPECEAGLLCTFFVCSTCFADSCGGDEICEVALQVPRPEGELGFWPAPLVCSPRGGVRAAGEPCGSDLDCASSSCMGTPRMICTDGRACTTDRDCPVVSGLAHGPCATIGVIGGTCQ
jgi:hypothetical protein